VDTGDARERNEEYVRNFRREVQDPGFSWQLLFVTSRHYSVVCGRYAEWATLIRQTSRQEVETDSCQIQKTACLMG